MILEQALAIFNQRMSGVFFFFQGGIDLNVFEAVKQSVTTRHAAEHYGIHRDCGE